MQPQEVTALVKDSNMKGRGGAGFSTGMKWSFVPMNVQGPKYLICNADEMEPGTFKDRWLLEGNPHQLHRRHDQYPLTPYRPLESGSYSCAGLTKWPRRRSAKRYRKPTTQVTSAKASSGTGYNLEMHLHTGVGRYMCGEETALLNSLEGRRAYTALQAAFPAGERPVRRGPTHREQCGKR